MIAARNDAYDCAERVCAECPSAEAPVHLAALAATLEALPAAALIVGGDLIVRHANAAGRRWLDDKRSDAREALRRCIVDNHDAFRVTAIAVPGHPLHWLLVHRCPQSGLTASALMAARLWRLTPRQTEVLVLLARGEANKTIAVTLGCEVSTVEAHVTVILRRAEVGSRAELIAKVWQIR